MARHHRRHRQAHHPRRLPNRRRKHERKAELLAIGRLGPRPVREAAGPDAEREPRGKLAGAIRRGDGRPGDWLVSSGPHGLSRLGLALLQAPEAPRATRLNPALRERAIQAHRRPRARLDAVRALIASRPAPSPWRVGGCDSSDGLAAAAACIAAASGCAARLERSALPLDPAMADLEEAEAWCLGGGEDFELVLALEPPWAMALVAALPGATRIGSLVAGTAGALGWADGSPWPEASDGWRHFG